MQSRVNLITDERPRLWRARGAAEVWLGVKSGSQKILDAMDKGTEVDAARTATRLLRQHGIRVCWFIQLGYPSEELGRHPRDARPDPRRSAGRYRRFGCLSAARHRVLRPGSRAARPQRNWRDTGELAMLFQGTFETGLYRRVRDLLHREVETGAADHEASEAIEQDAQDPHFQPLFLAAGT